MNKYFINYSSNGFKGSQLEGLDAATRFGFISKGYSDSDLSQEFKEKNKQILSQPRGGGYWIWKPYIIMDMFNKMNEGDYLVYMDSGAKFIKDPSNFLRMINHKGILSFNMIHPQGRWCKGDCFHAIPFSENYRFEKQIQGTYIFLRKCEASINFVKEWLEYCETYNPELITDMDNVNKANFPEFIEHRHDQSILSLLIYANDIMYIPQIDQYCTEQGYGHDWIYVDRHGRRY